MEPSELSQKESIILSFFNSLTPTQQTFLTNLSSSSTKRALVLSPSDIVSLISTMLTIIGYAVEIIKYYHEHKSGEDNNAQ